MIDGITLDGGRQMWTVARWQAFVPRLRRWMTLWEATGRRHGLQAGEGFLLGQARAGHRGPDPADERLAGPWTP